MKNHKTFYRKNLPHWQPKGGVFSITICLSGSLPKAKIKALQDAQQIRFAEIDQMNLADSEKKSLIKIEQQLYFGKFDDLLNNNTQGPTWLNESRFAHIIAEGLHYRDGKDFKLVCYCIMSNHIHCVVYKCQRQLFNILKNFKSFTGREVNKLLYGKAKKGERHPSFWQHESYDHLICDRRDFNNQVRYVVNNPVKAGLVKYWEDWEFTYLRNEFEYIAK